MTNEDVSLIFLLAAFLTAIVLIAAVAGWKAALLMFGVSLLYVGLRCI